MRKLSLLLLIPTFLFSYEIVEDETTLPILTPHLAEREMAKIRLQNGLEAYLISDPGCSLSAAALSIEAGSWQDPPEYPGTAHFLEHMLFMGTEAFPKESDYANFIHDHGGEENAFTAADRTLYAFSVDHDAFPGALERFSHFFIDPLLSSSSMGREVHAVDEEYAMHKEEEGWRRWMVFKETGNPLHPNHSFCMGNIDTLEDLSHQTLSEWYSDHYRANWMHLALLSPLPVPELIHFTEELFSPVESSPSPKSSFPEPISSEEQRGKMIFITPQDQTRKLELVWEVPQKFATDRERYALELTATALGQETENSLSSLLKQEGLIESLDIDLDQVSREHLLFSIELNLTEKGIDQLDTVILSCFETIATLREKGIPLYLFDEMQGTSRAYYQFQSRSNSFDTAIFHADHLIDEELATYPEKTFIPHHYDSDFISEFIHTLTPVSCIFILTADPKLSGTTCDQTEYWTTTDYTIHPLPEEKLETWAAAPSHILIDLPPPNPLLVHPQPVKEDHCQLGREIPLLIEEDLGEIYYARDCTYLVPKYTVLFTIHTPLLTGSCKNTLFMEFFLKAFMEKYATLLYFADEAGIDHSFSNQGDSLSIEIEGFSAQMPLFLKELFHGLTHLSVTSEEFEQYKYFVLNSYDTESPPLEEAKDTLAALFSSSQEEVEEESSEEEFSLETLSYDAFITFTQDLFKELFIEGLFYGDLSHQESLSLWEEIKNTLSAQPYLVEEDSPSSLLSFTQGKDHEVIESDSDQPGHVALLVCHQGNYSLESRGAQKILSTALNEAFFDTLRTKQQTGYLVSSWDEVVARELFQILTVQSYRYPPRELLSRFEAFLEDFSDNLENEIPEMRFAALKQSMILSLKAPAENLSARAQELFHLAFSKGDFFWVDKCLSAWEGLCYEEFLHLARDFLSLNDHGTIAVLIKGTS
jgi:insulysin